MLATFEAVAFADLLVRSSFQCVCLCVWGEGGRGGRRWEGVGGGGRGGRGLFHFHDPNNVAGNLDP